MLGCAAIAVVELAWAQTWKFEPSIAVQETATNNVDLAPTDQRVSDLVTTITPAFTVHELGDHTRLDGTVVVPVLIYARTGAENNYVAPSVNLLGDVNFFDRVLHLEGAINVSQQFYTPFGAQPGDLVNATDNRYRSTVYRLSPYVQGTLSNGIDYELRNNNVWTNLSGAPIDTNNARYTEFLAKAETTGSRQIGWKANFDYNNIRFNQQDSIITQLGRFVPYYNADASIQVGASGGYEDNQYALTSSRGAIYGLGLRWRPTERTDVVANWEHRFFGSSYLFTFDHRTPLSVWNVRVSRNITTYPQQIGRLGAGADVTAFVDQLFLSSIPDANDRQQAVDQFIRDRGLPPTLSDPVTLYAEQIVLQQSQSATAGLIGARNSILFSIFNVKNEPIAADGVPLPPSLFSGNNNTQTGGSVVWNNRLTQAVNLSATMSGYRTVANAPLNGYTNQAIARVILSAPFSGRMTGFIGARYQTLNSDLTNDYNEAAAFLGIRYALR